MAKLTIAEAESLHKEGVLSDAALKEMQDKGLVSTRTRNEKRVMKTSEGTHVTPQFYFQGLEGKPYSKKMTELKSKVQSLVNEYTTTIKIKK
tara:strand:- start:332 stop:607 length:276 start_codon:yes stop_codon:yes gene_type:complete